MTRRAAGPAALLCLAAWFVACGTGASGGGGSSGGGGTSGGSGAASSSGGGGSSGGATWTDAGLVLDVPGADASCTFANDVAIAGETTDPTVTFAIQQDVGTFTPAGGSPEAAMVYERIPWPQFGYTLYQTLSVGPTDWEIAWFYCADGGVTDFESETTRGDGVQALPVAGSCTDAPTSVTEPVSFPPSALTLDSLLQDVRVEGADLSLSDAGPGRMSLAGQAWTVYPFSEVDCSEGCGTPGWYELHSLFWDGSGESCFGIFYLVLGTPSQVELDYVICLPRLDDPTDGGADFEAAWTHA